MNHVVVTKAMSGWDCIVDISARDRDRQRIEKISELIESVSALAVDDRSNSPETDHWRRGLGLLLRYLAATHLQLPKVEAITDLHAVQVVPSAVADARHEINAALIKLAQADADADAAGGRPRRSAGR